jgi:hypothetical protein
MAADIIETSEPAIRAAHKQQWLADQFGGEVVARRLHLARVPHHLPGARKYVAFLLLECAGFEIKKRRQRPRARDVRINQVGINVEFVSRARHVLGWEVKRGVSGGASRVIPIDFGRGFSGITSWEFQFICVEVDP